MQENLEIRTTVKVLGWIHTILASILFFCCCTMALLTAIGAGVYFADKPKRLNNPYTDPKLTIRSMYEEHRNTNQYKDDNILRSLFEEYGWFALIYFSVNAILCVTDMWIGEGLIHAAHMDEDISNSRVLAKRYIIWNAIVYFVGSLLFVVCWPIVCARLVMVTYLPAAVRLNFCYIVSRFIRSLRKTSAVTQNLV